MAGVTDPTNLAPFLSVLRERRMEDEELFQLESSIEAMRETPGWRALEEIIDAVEARGVRRLKFGSSSVDDHAQLAREIGMLAGLEVARHASEAVVHRADQIRAEVANEQGRRQEAAARGT